MSLEKSTPTPSPGRHAASKSPWPHPTSSTRSPGGTRNRYALVTRLWYAPPQPRQVFKDSATRSQCARRSAVYRLRESIGQPSFLPGVFRIRRSCGQPAPGRWILSDGGRGSVAERFRKAPKPRAIGVQPLRPLEVIEDEPIALRGDGQSRQEFLERRLQLELSEKGHQEVAEALHAPEDFPRAGWLG